MVRAESVSYQKNLAIYGSLEKILEANTVQMTAMLGYRTASLPLSHTLVLSRAGM